MAIKVYWSVPHRILTVELEGMLNFDDFKRLDHIINDCLDHENPGTPVVLMVDITRQARIPQAFAQIKATQTCLHRPELQWILVAGKNKFMRLMMMLTYNLCRQSLRLLDDVDQAIDIGCRLTNRSQSEAHPLTP